MSRSEQIVKTDCGRQSTGRRAKMKRCWFAAGIFWLAGALAAYAQDDVVERQLKAAPGRDVRVGVFTAIRPDCTSGPLPAIRLATPPAHGSVNVKRGTLKATNIKQCHRGAGICRILSCQRGLQRRRRF
jgi:hypothetical protein